MIETIKRRQTQVVNAHDLQETIAVQAAAIETLTVRLTTLEQIAALQ